MPSEKETQLYFQARDRALIRHVEGNEFYDECLSGFKAGLAASDGNLSDGNIFDKALADKLKSESNFAFCFVLALLSKMESVKGRSYGSSWQKRGEVGVLPNLMRKIDRLDTLLGSPTDAGENLSQTLGDAAVYSAKWLLLRAEIDPKEFSDWVLEVQNLIKKDATPRA